MSKLVRSTVLSHIGIFNSDSSIFHWEHPHVMYDGRERDVVILQVLPHDEERFLVEFIFNEDAEIIFEDEYDIIKMKLDERCENVISAMKKPADDDTSISKRYNINPFEDFKDHILEKFPHEKVGEHDVKLQGVNITDTDVKSMYPSDLMKQCDDDERVLAGSNGMLNSFGVADAMDYVIGRANQAVLDEQYMREAVCEKLSKALNKGDDPGEPGDDGYTYVEGYGENEQDD